MKKLAAFILVTMSSLNIACTVDRPYNTQADENLYELNYLSFSNNTDEDINVFDGMLMGDIGTIKDINSSATIGGFHDDAFTSLEVVMTNSNGSAMVLLSIDGSITHEDLAPNSVHRFAATSPPNREGLFIGGVVCSGEGSAGNWDYDDIANMVEVEVEQREDPDVQRLNFTTTTEDDIATGHVDVFTGDI
mgnify:FL=1